ncbi:MAG: helix-turn-helix domain-containing protein [Actinomycetes bacterium]
MQDVQKEKAPHSSGGRLLTATEVQHRLGVDRSTVYRMALDGRLVAVKVGRQWRFPASAIEDLLPQPAAVGFGVSRESAFTLITVTAELLGVMMVVTDMDGQPITEVANPSSWYAQRAQDPRTLDVCTTEWRGMADDLQLQPEFHSGALGFECARSFIRSGHQLIGMVLAGGVAPLNSVRSDLYSLTEDERARVLETLPRVAAALSRAHVRPQHGIEGSQ